jgi:hypothetical protein
MWEKSQAFDIAVAHNLKYGVIRNGAGGEGRTV